MHFEPVLAIGSASLVGLLIYGFLRISQLRQPPKPERGPRLVALPKPGRETIEAVARRVREQSEARRGVPSDLEGWR